MATKKKTTSIKTTPAKKRKSRDKAMKDKETKPSKLLAPAKPCISHAYDDALKTDGEDSNSPFALKQAIRKEPFGRPTKYEPRFCQMLVDHQAAGFSFESFAGLIGVCIDTTYEWAKARPDFSDAKRRGHAASLMWWENAGMVGMAMPSKVWTPAVHSRNMNARFPEYGWRGDRVAEAEAETDDILFVAEFS